MENRDFYDTIVEFIALEKSIFNHDMSKKSFLALAEICDMPENCFDQYNEKYDYKRVFLSSYYHSALHAYEDDFDGKPLGTYAARQSLLRMEEIMRKREAVSKYIEYSVSFERYAQLKERYELV